MNEAPKYLYKYMSKARLNVLRNLSIRFTQPSALNDPFEFNLLFTNIVSTEELREYYASLDKQQFIRETLESLPAEQKAIIRALPPSAVNSFIESFTANLVNSKFLDKLHEQQIAPRTNEVKELMWSALNKSAGILSLSSNPTSPPMWASYADNSKGLALEFDTCNPFFNRRRSEKDEFYHLRQVVYEDRSSEGTLLEMKPDILIHKSKSWEYECEWRMLAPLEQANSKFTSPEGDEIYLYEFPASAVSRIILGLNSDEQLIHDTIEITKSNHAYSHILLSKIKKGPTGFVVAPLETC